MKLMLFKKLFFQLSQFSDHLLGLYAVVAAASAAVGSGGSISLVCFPFYYLVTFFFSSLSSFRMSVYLSGLYFGLFEYWLAFLWCLFVCLFVSHEWLVG